MESILNKLIKIKTNLSLGIVKFISEQDILVNLDGNVLKANKDVEGNIHWENKSVKIEPLESALLQCVITPYIQKLISVVNSNEKLINKEFSLEDIQSMYLRKITICR